ncbi:phosphoenolpyruvate--protein phosphotransferase [Kineosporia sp. NBRC 101731]|uniref:phosphoenolpyruvate--protein phosphotransferase n=1 Tax=Kineosporia sp. NBRC 101731 TaxID=3032199 RepID=UPI0024A1AAE8|nr:phosphoenolpyruvate--protein phosphotransferase [Kineosporia sp. NBRC 101731]GLY30022.1 multiphosphoryl transfer protein [Kineosporia sp. NBRC 101731]
MDATVGIVVVSHSRPLARAAVALAGQMTPGAPVRVAVAAGLDEETLGTDAVAIGEAVTSVDGAAGVLVLMDLGSAVLSAELALELLDEETRRRVLLCPAPLVEGLVAAVVTAAGGAGLGEVATEARNGLAGKQSQLSEQSEQSEPYERSGTTPELSGPAIGQAPAESARFVITPAHGLHARPAARLVTRLREIEAQVEIRNATTGSVWVPALSLTRVTTLGVLAGHEVQVRATGAEALIALERIAALAASNFGEPTGPVDDLVSRQKPSASASAASPGIAIGPVHRATHAPRLDDPGPADVHHRTPELEKRALATAREAVRRHITGLEGLLARDEAEIFETHLALLDDPDLLGRTHARIGDGEPAARAWAATARETAGRFDGLADPYLAARAADVRAVGEQVLAQLLPPIDPVEETLSGPGILVVEDLTAAQAATLDGNVTRGVVMAAGSPSGHAAILIRARGIPAVAGAGAFVHQLPDGTVVALDGTTGELVIDPSDNAQQDFRARAETARRNGEVALRQTHSPAVTRDGVRIAVGANASTPAEATAARARGADLIGLVRTEFLFLSRDTPPDVDEQEAAYLDLADAFGGERITLRTLDVGGDKPLGYLPMPVEANPFLGVRGLRLGLRRPAILTEQLRAIVRVARQTPVGVMFPMVSTLDELRSARRLLDEVVGARAPVGLRVGIMVEVPAAALKAASLAPYVDFLSIGTNDLTQYTLAAERGNDDVATLGDPFDPAVLKLIRATCDGAAGRAEVAVCGEFAADVRAVPLLAGLGVTELSVTPRSVPDIKQAIRTTDLGESRELASEALEQPSAEAVREVLRRRLAPGPRQK